MDFNNTEVAFSGKSNADLSRSYWLFKIIGWNWLIKISPVLLKIFMPLWIPIPIIKGTIFKQFCGGESIDECERTINQLSTQNVKTILDYSVEGIEKESVFDENVIEALAAINTAIKINPKNYYALNLKGLLLRDKGEFLNKKYFHLKGRLLTAHI